MKLNNVYEMLIRYLALIVLGGFNLALFYTVFTPLTVYPFYWIVRAIDDSARLFPGNLIFFSGFYVEIIAACVAGAAYYLLLILNLTTPMELNKRIKSIGYLIFVFLFLNITRIFIFSALLFYGYEYFDFAHRFTWYFGSTVLVILIWFSNVWLFRIKNIPIYSDFKNIFGDIFSKRRK